jgi:prepilin-type N-terminal cleavage/methylation domain-containing protein
MPRADRALRRRGPEVGFTLLEMLVTLVIVSVVTTLLWQALALTARIEQSLAGSQQTVQDQRLRAAWVQQALAGLAVPPGTETALRGSPTRIDAVTTAPPWPGSAGPEAMVLEWRTGDPETAGWQRLTARRPATGEVFDLGAWDASLRFDYLNADGRWVPTWPPSGLAERAETAQRPLPRAVRLAPSGAPGLAPEGSPDAGVIVVAPQATRNPMLARAQAQPQDDTR